MSLFDSQVISDASILTQGLIDYYNSQAQLVLTQYENINRLLGPTTDWTHPGTLCEVLIRNFLRNTLVAGISVDKGFIYGQASTGGKSSHSPEVDLLIHDTRRYRPLFQMDDFVIVYPQAVFGIIQVKRKLTWAQVNKGLKNVISAKQFVLEVLPQDQASPSRYSPYLFSAIMGFDDDLDDPGKAKDRYNALIKFWYRKLEEKCGLTHNTILSVLPDFIGSLKHQYSFRPIADDRMGEYYTLKSIVKDKNVVLQTLAALLNLRIGKRLGLESDQLPVWAVPNEPRELNAFLVEKSVET